MQIQKDQIKRPRLIESFFHLELTPSNDYVEYINTTSADKNVTSLQNNSIQNLLTSKFIKIIPELDSHLSLSILIRFASKESRQKVRLRNILRNNVTMH